MERTVIARRKLVYPYSLFANDLITLYGVIMTAIGSSMIHMARTITYDDTSGHELDTLGNANDNTTNTSLILTGSCTMHDKLYSSSLAIGIIDLLYGLAIVFISLWMRTNIIKLIRENNPINEVNKESIKSLEALFILYNNTCIITLIILAIVTSPVYNTFNPSGCNITLYTLGFVSMYVLYPIVLSVFATICVIIGVYHVLKNIPILLYKGIRNLTGICSSVCGCYSISSVHTPPTHNNQRDTVIQIGESQDAPYNTECPICLSSPTILQNPAVILHCNHMICTECSKKMNTCNPNHKICPLCRNSVSQC
jgi:hypothetical protein